MDRLLILDDEPAIGDLVARVANSLRMEVKAVESASAFRKRLDDWEPTLLVIDLLVPEQDGVELLRSLAEKKVSVPVVLISGVEERVLHAARRAAVEKGLKVVGILNKPFSVNELKQLLLQSSTSDAAASPSSAEKPDLSGFRAEDLERAIRRQEICIALQPKIDCRTRQVAGFEALARWHWRGRTLDARQFIGHFEDAGLIEALSALVFEQALSWFGEQALPPEIDLCLNFPPSMLRDTEFPNRLAATCERHDIEPSKVILELTENDALRDENLVLEATTSLRLRGFQLAIEDVGSQFSWLARLAHLPLSALKIDQPFVQNLQGNPDFRAIVETLIFMGHNLGLRVIAEGVENAAMDEFLVESGCDLAQGFFYSRPIEPGQADGWSTFR